MPHPGLLIAGALFFGTGIVLGIIHLRRAGPTCPHCGAPDRGLRLCSSCKRVIVRAPPL